MNKLKSIVLGSMAVAALLVTGSAFAESSMTVMAQFSGKIPANTTVSFGVLPPGGDQGIKNLGPIGPSSKPFYIDGLVAGTRVTPVLILSNNNVLHCTAGKFVVFYNTPIFHRAVPNITINNNGSVDLKCTCAGSNVCLS